MRLVKERPDLGLGPLPRGQLPRMVVLLVAKLPGHLLLGGLVRLDVELVEDGEGGLR